MGLFEHWFTLVVIPNKTSRVIRLRIPRALLMAGVGLLTGLLVLGGYALVRSVELGNQLEAYRDLESSHLAQRVALQKFTVQMDTLKGQLGRLRGVV